MGFNEPRSRHSVGADGMHSHAQTTPKAASGKDTFRVPVTAPAKADKDVPVLTPTAPLTPATGFGHSALEDSLRQIDEDQTGESTAKKRRFGGDKDAKKKRPTRKQIIRRSIAALVVIILVVAGFVITKGILAGTSVFKGDIFGLIQQKPLQQDANGRTNILLFGTSEDDPGHQGANLTDSIMVLSVDQNNKNAYMVSIPRDLRVKYGMDCLSGSYGKINVYFSCVSDGTTKEAEDERQVAMRKFVGDIVGMDIQYSAHVNYSVVRDVVGALGTITVNIEGSNGDPGVMDSNFDWKCKGGNEYASLATMKKNCPPNGHFIDYPNGPATLDAEHALYLAQARGDSSPTYGLSRSNYDRELNQQKIIKAIKEKAMSVGVLTNPVTVSNLLDAMGSNLRTNFDTSEIRTLMNLAKDIPNDAVQSISLIDAEPSLFASDGEGNVIPAAGTYDYSAIQAYIRKKIAATPVEKESAHVMILNGSGIAGAAATEQKVLTNLGMVVDEVGNAPQGDYKANIIYQIKKDGSDGKPNTAKKLQELYGVAPVQTALPTGITPAADTEFVIILFKPTATQTTGNQ